MKSSWLSWILVIIFIVNCMVIQISADETFCQCHDMPSCRCDRFSCKCKQRAIPPCICRIPQSNEFEHCIETCKPTCLGSCIILSTFETCETTCNAACSLACPQKIKRQHLSSSLGFTCVNDCLADCLLSRDYQKQALLDGKAKLECESNCKSSCDQTVTMAMDDITDDMILFAVKKVDLKGATFSKYDCSQRCGSNCLEKCKTSGAPDDVCLPTCDHFCSEKCDLNYVAVPQAVCMKSCQPDCDRKCVLDKTLDLVFGFAETAKNITASLPSLTEIFNTAKGFNSNTPLEPTVSSEPVVMSLNPLPIASSPEIVARPAEIKLPQSYHSYNCHRVCLPSCHDQCEALNRPGLNCTRLCERTCELNCAPDLGSTSNLPKQFHSYSKEEIQSKCREQLSLKCSTLCQSPECLEICASSVRFLCTRSAECNGICQSTCKQHCLVKDKAFAQCEPQCSESCQRECRLSDDIRSECQNNCLGNCGKKCETTSPNVPLMYQCNTNCPQLCHSVCYE